MRSLARIAAAFSLALRNVWRNRRRASITLASIIVGTLALLYLGSYVTTMDQGLKGNAINKEFGHFQIARTGYFSEDAHSARFLLGTEEVDAISEALAGMDSVDDSVQQLQLIGMIGTAKNSAVFSALCIQTDTLHELSPGVIDGEPLSSTAPDGILIGQTMAKRLGVRKGDPVLLFISSEGGSQEAVSATIRGIYKGLMKEQEQTVIYMPIDTAWDLLLERKAHRFICFASSMEGIDAAMADARRLLAEKGLDVELKRWDELAVYYRQIVRLFSGLVAAAAALIFIVIMFGISNTMYMTVSERTPEIGTVRALGEGRLSVVTGFLLEGLLLGVAGAAAGILIVWLSAPLINSLHLTLPPGPGQDELIPIYLTPTVGLTLVVCAVNVAAAALATLLPAIKAVRLSIAEALRFV